MEGFNYEETLKEAEHDYQEIVTYVQSLRSSVSSSHTEPSWILTPTINTLLSLEERAKGQLNQSQYFRLCKLLGRLYPIAVDHSGFAKTQRRLYKYLSRSCHYLRLAFQNPAASLTESLILRIEWGIECVDLAWTLIGSTDDPVERLVRNVDWSEYLSDVEIQDLLTEAREVLAESMNDASKMLTPGQCAHGWEQFALAHRVLAVTSRNHLSAAHIYLIAANFYRRDDNIQASIQATANAVLEFAKANDWEMVAENSQELLQANKLGSETSLKSNWDLCATVASEIAISSYHLNQSDKAQHAISTLMSPLIYSWTLPIKSAASLESGLLKAKANLIKNAQILIEGGVLSNLDSSGGSFWLQKVFNDQPVKHQKPTRIKSTLLNPLRNIFRITDSNSASTSQSTIREHKNTTLRLSSNTALIEFACGYNETVAFITLPDGLTDSLVLPKLNLRSIRDKLVTFENGQPRSGWLHSYLKYRHTISHPNKSVSSSDEETMKSLVLEPLDDLLAWLYEVFSEPLISRLSNLAEQVGSAINHLILVPGSPLGFIPLHGAYKTEENKRKYFLDDFSISYCPLGAFARLDQATASGNKISENFLTALHYQEQLTPFMTLDQHFARRGLAPSGFVSIASVGNLGKRAKKQLNNYLSKSTHLLVSSHGIADLKRPLLNSGLFLGENELSEDFLLSIALDILKDKINSNTRLKPNVSILDLIEMPLSRCKVVFLGSCESAMSSSLPQADNGLSPAVAFLLAGAEQAIAPMWLAHDLASVLICKEVFENIARGLHGSLALSTAQQKIRELTWGEIIEQLSSIVSQPKLALLLSIDLEDPIIKISRPFEHPWFWIGYQSWIRRTDLELLPFGLQSQNKPLADNVI